MALRSLSRAGVEVGGRMAGKGRVGATMTHRNLIASVERKSSSFVGQGQGQGHFGRSQTPSYRQGVLFFQADEACYRLSGAGGSVTCDLARKGDGIASKLFGILVFVSYSNEYVPVPKTSPRLALC